MIRYVDYRQRGLYMAIPSTKIITKVPTSILEDIDRAAQEDSRTRSEVVREALREYADRRKIIKDHNKQLVLGNNLIKLRQ